ncbi:MAG: Spy/CpxP family protein refolding chaperone [Chthoniobacterales bacterium]
MKCTLITLAIASTLGLGAIAGLQAEDQEGRGERHGRHGHHGMGGGGKWGNPLEHLTKDLDLTTEQQAAVAPIVEQAKPQMRAIHEEAMQKAKAVMDNAEAQIRPLLKPEQQQKLDAMKKAHDDMLAAKHDMHEARENN